MASCSYIYIYICESFGDFDFSPSAVNTTPAPFYRVSELYALAR